MAAPASVEAADAVYIFSPEEPELRIVVGGKMYRFSNSRLDMSRTKHPEEIAFFESDPRFMVGSDLSDPRLLMELQNRLIGTMSRRADASNARMIFNDAMFMAQSVTTQEGSVQFRPQDIPGAMAIIAKALPRSSAEAAALPYEQTTRAAEDAKAVAWGAAGVSDPDALEIEKVKTAAEENSDAGLPDSFTNPFGMPHEAAE